MTDCKGKYMDVGRYEMEQKFFEKSIILLDYTFECYKNATLQLFYCMEDTNRFHNIQTQFFKLRMKYPEKDIVGDVRELMLEWSAI